MGNFLSYAPDVAARVLGRHELSREANAGLVWDRYFPVWEGHPPRRSKTLLQPLEAFASAFNGRGQGGRNPPRDLLRRHRERLVAAMQSFAEACGGACEAPAFRVAWRLVTGLGSDHPTNNGFGFDPLVGVPYLPGSSVKGLCRRAAGLDRELSGRRITELFGPERVGPGTREGQGGLFFFDAYPRRWPQLAVDIVNCHHWEYYHGGERGPNAVNFPKETEDPIPAFFLAVEAGTEFVFPMLARDRADLDTAVSLLRIGLDVLGIGAKTAVGYGYMDEVEPKT